MKKKSPMLSVRIGLLFFLAVCTFAHNVQAQCSASIQSNTLTVCAGTDVDIPVTLEGVAPFVITYQINGVPLPPVQASSAVFNFHIPNVTQTMAVQLSGVLDAIGCQSPGSGQVIIQVPPSVTVNPSVTNPTCSTDHDGAIEVFPVGGSAPYAYQWSNGATTQEITGLDAGTYAVTVTDASGCPNVFTYVLVHVLPTFQYDLTPSACNMSNGAIDIHLTSPTAFNVWSNGTTTEDLIDIPAGAYNVTVTESATGCTRAQGITVPESAPGIMSSTVTPANCSGPGVGAVNVVVSGGTLPYAYLWSNGATSQGITDLSAGTYTVSVTDAAGCTSSFWANVTSTSNLFLNATVQQPTCNDLDGGIDLSVSGGSPPYSFLWSNGAVTEDLSGVGTGTYTVTVTENGGCTSTTSKTLVPFSVTSTTTVVNCMNTISLNITGGTPPFIYLWPTGNTTSQVTGISQGTYLVSVTDALGCEVTTTVISIAPPAPTVTIDQTTSACTGGVYATMAGVQPNNTSFLWSTGATTRLISNIATGTYSVTATSNISGCSATATFTTTQPLTNSFLSVNVSAINVSCSGANNGAISLSVSGAYPPFAYHWNTNANTSQVTNLPAGTYIVTVTDANGCSIIRTQSITQPTAMVASWQVSPPNCNNNTGNIGLGVSGGTAPYTYLWSNGVTTPVLSGIASGSYWITIVDANGCVYASPEIIVAPLPLFSASIQTLSTQCSSATLTVNTTGGTGPFTYQWTGPNGFVSTAQNLVVTFSGAYTVLVTSVNGCIAQATVQVDLAGTGTCGYISGRVVRDESDDCLADAAEPGLGGWLVRAQNASNVYYGVSNPDGHYWVGVPTGTYEVVTIPPNALWATCEPAPSATVVMPDDTIEGVDLPVKVVYLCPTLSVNIGSGLLRRCNSGIYYLDYCNQGTTDATDVYLLVTLDPFLTPGASSFPYTDLGGGVLQFNIGDLAAGQCGYFNLGVQVSCNAVLGQTHCTEAHIYPDGNCIPSNSSWSGASLRVTSHCNADTVHFTIKNVGDGDMNATSNYIVVEDAVMLMSAPFELGAGDSTIVAVPANGSTWRVEVQQVPFHPGFSAPALSVEGCSNTASFSTGFVTQFPNDEQDAWIDIDCKQNVGSWDPNDKQGFPIGYGSERYIRPGTELEYTIRFQNTGTDTAFTVRVADTLSTWLDVATIRPGASSHPYRFNLTGPGYAEFLFENIMLPDSNVNVEGSNGFVKFSIYPKADAPLETLIENTANIYFDQNEAVVTNTTRHRLGENFVTVGLWQPQRPQYEVLVSPNPFGETARLEVKGLESTLPIHLQVMDLRGKIVRDETSAGTTILLKKGNLPAGMYLFKLDQKGAPVGSGKLIVKD